MDISDLLQGPLKDIIINQVGNQLGLDNNEKTNVAVDGIFATLLNGLTKNASTPEGESSLQNALQKDHDGSILDDLTGFLNGTMQTSNPKTANGAGILKHILGDEQTTAVDNISKASGIDTGKIIKMMMMLAPIVLGFLGKSNNSAPTQQSGGGGLLDILTGATKTVNTQSSASSILDQILGGGSASGGGLIENVAKSVLGKLFGGK
ncbi:MAG: DUF937 domain-containing protein [Saprospiraceae bacterium]|nr:MAG: hypothetical protein UZ09_BCD002000262 [Bacteroidetes bacterium OLB9]MCO6464277.1 DUF937 domain-containing protein [Saprospiraceae bacterium]MCZ2337849.1 DUF937 domain-containing protein [Chitinophagales bacterium]